MLKPRIWISIRWLINSKLALYTASSFFLPRALHPCFYFQKVPHKGRSEGPSLCHSGGAPSPLVADLKAEDARRDLLPESFVKVLFLPRELVAGRVNQLPSKMCCIISLKGP